MIEGCIVAKLVLGYLREEGLYRTCSAFQDECSLFHDNNKELDNVFLTADLKTILDDYSQLRESGNGVPSGTAVLKSLWKDLDIVIGQLKYATIPSSTSNASMESQSTRTRRLNHGRSRRSILPKTKESITTGTTSNSSTTQLPSRPNGGNVTEKLPLQKPSTTTLSPKMLSSSHKNQTTDLQPASASGIAQNTVPSTADKEPVRVHSTSSTVQYVGSAVAFSSPCMADDSQAARTSINTTPTVSSVGNSCDSHTSNELSRSADVEEGMFDGVDEGDLCNDQECDNRGTVDKSPPVIVIDNERSKGQRVLTVEEHSLSHSHHNQDELQLRSPKRKGIQPKKRVSQGATGTSADSPVKLVPESAEIEMDITCSADTLTPHSFLGTLLSTPLLQEKLAENINKIVGSSRQQPVSDEPPSATMQSLTTTEASSDDTLTALNQGAGGDIPVKEIMDLMQTDPAFDVLFSFFGLDALDALPSAGSSAADSTCTVLQGTSAESNQLNNSTSCVSSSGVHLPDVLGSSSSPGECQSDSGAEITSMLPTGSHQQVETSTSSSTSDLHLSATSIVTDALLLLAGSPDKMPSQAQTQLDHSACVLPSVQRSLATPPKKTHPVQRHSTDDTQTSADSLCNQPSLITSTFPYVRALNFNLDHGPEPPKRGARKGSKKGTKQKATTDEQRKTPLSKKGAKSRHVATSKSSSTSSSPSDTGVGYRNIHVQSVSPSTVAPNIYTGIGQPLANCSSAFNRTSNPIHSSVSVVAPVASSNTTSSYNVVNCGTLPTAISVCSPAIRPSPSPGYPVPSTVAYINPASSPTGSLLAPVNPINGPSPSPVNFTGAVISHSLSPANHASQESTTVLINHNNLSTCTTPPTVSFTTSGTIHAPSPLIVSNAGSVCSPSPISVTTQYLSGAPTVASFMNPIECATSSSVNPASTGIGHNSLPASLAHSNFTSISSATSSHPITCATSSSVDLANACTGHNSLPASFARSNLTAMSSVTSLHQVVNTVPPSPLTGLTQAVVPGHFTDSTVTSATTSIRNSPTGPEQSVGESSESGVTSASSEASDAGVTQSRSQVSCSPISLQASNLLQALALQHTNTETNEPQNITSGLEVTQLRKESVQGMQKISPRSSSELALGHQPLKEKSSSKKNTNVSKDNTTVSVEKRKDSIPLVCESSSADVFEKGLRNTVPVAGRLPNSLGDKNGGSSSLTIMNQGCRELLKKNSTAFLQSGTSSEREGQGSSKPRGKRRRDSLQKEKEKKTKSSSRPSKRSKTKAENINFPSDLNVEEFLSKLQYEVK